MRQLQFAYLDMAWFTTNESVDDIDSFENNVTKKTRLLPKIPQSLLSTSFSHIFAGGYSAGYYSYKWSEVLDADAFSVFKEKGIFNKEVADKFKEYILSKGGSIAAEECFKKFQGREPDIKALLLRDGVLSK